MSVQELEHGVSFTFENTDDVARMVLDLVLAERHCCSQFTYSVVFEPQLAPIQLRIQAPALLIEPLKGLYAALSPVTDHHG